MKYYHGLLQISLIVMLLSVTVASAQDAQEVKLAESYQRSGNHDAALFIFQKLYREGNSSPKVINGIAGSLEALNRITELIDFLKGVVNKNPGIFTYEIDLANAYFLNKQNDVARQMWRRIYQSKPANLMQYRLVAQAMTQFRLFDEAIEVYKEALQNLKNQDAIHLDIGTLYRAQLNYEKAVEHYIIYFRKFKKQQSYIRSLLIGMAKDDEAADRIITTLEKLNYDNDPDINELLANLYIRIKDYEKAFNIIKNIEESDSGQQFAYLSRFAAEAERDGAYAYVIKTYEYVLSSFKTNTNSSFEYRLADAYYMYGMQLFAGGSAESADSQIKKSQLILSDLINSNSTEKFFAAELFADIYKEYFNDLDKALEYYQRVNLNAVGANKADQVRLKMAEVYLLKNELVQSKKVYNEIKSKKFLSLALYSLAELNYFTAHFSAATEQYQRLISTVGMKDTLANNALERLFDIEQFAKDSITFAKYADADLLQRQKKYSEAAKKFSEIYEQQKAVSLPAAYQAVKLYDKLDKTDEAIALLEDCIARYPDDENSDRVLFDLAGNYKKQQKWQQAIENYQHILQRFPNSFYSEQARTFARELNHRIQDQQTP
ncbi:MAG: tetratricopeptide repeat protein [Calditrichaeota bacterium]|nr:tetratricopeptide repeat protein [Calditrichota bacterium]